ncbi:MAG: hypothetical protein GF331_07240, partial [Chitinivibrionales bacterium]|nr:hypothetical protein [Chitinivibrionales bacterium]
MAKTEKETPYAVLLVGDDTISRERYRGSLLERIRQARGEISIEAYDSDRETVADFVERAMTPSLFGGVRVFTIRHVEQLAKQDLEALTRLIGTPLPDEYVVMEADKPSERAAAFASFTKRVGKLAKSSDSRVSTVSLAKPPEYKIAEWLVSNTPQILGRRIGRREAEYLIDLVGSDFDALRSELEKLDVYLDDGEPITSAAIGEVIEGTRAVGGYELAQALGRKDVSRALTVLDGLFSVQFYAPAVLSAIYRHFWALHKIHLLGRGEPQVITDFLRAQRSYDRDTQSRLGVRIGSVAGLMNESQGNRVYPMLIKPRLVEQSRSFDEAHYRAIFEWLGDIDVGVKTGRIEATLPMMQLLCVRVVQGPSVPEDL